VAPSLTHALAVSAPVDSAVAHNPPALAVAAEAIRAPLDRLILSFGNGDGAVTRSKSARSSRQQEHLNRALVLAETRYAQKG